MKKLSIIPAILMVLLLIWWQCGVGLFNVTPKTWGVVSIIAAPIILIIEIITELSPDITLHFKKPTIPKCTCKRNETGWCKKHHTDWL